MSKHGKYLLLLAGALLATSCVDDPVSVDDKLIEAAADLPAHLQHQHQATGEDVDPFRPRLKVDFRVIGELRPNTPITVWLEAEAIEQITEGEVEVALPTFAAMKLGGPTKTLQYEKGKSAPSVARWTLSAMEVGDTWKETVEIGEIAEKGYYQVTARIDTQGPTRSTYVIDQTLREAWMYIADEGGMLTSSFDETIFPKEIIPQPGPFQSWYTSTSGSSAGAAADASGAASAGRISIEFLTVGPHNGRNIAMKGAEVRAEYIERGRVVSTVTRTVPSSGIIRFNCPGYAEQRIVGSVKNDDTPRVNGGHRLASWQVRYHECGDEKQVQGARHLYLPWANLERAIPKITKLFGYSRRAVDFEVKDTMMVGGRYSQEDDLIKFGNSYASLLTAGHEYTHALHHKALGGGWHARNCGVSDRQGRERYPTNYKCAMKEGLANFGGHVGSGPEGTGKYWEPSSRLIRPASGRGAGEYENNVAALFRDLLDSGNETGDETSYSGRYVFTVFKTCRTPNSPRDIVADFVWCLERRVDDAIHRRYVPGESPPSSVRESASEPADWDADDIRSTWVKNVGEGR